MKGQPASAARLLELAGVFARLGATAFGGPAAHVGMMEQEVVRRRNWLTQQELLDLIGATNLIPGPNSTELAIHIGFRRAGWPGLIVAGSCFILPAFAMVTGLAWAYARFGQLPQAEGLLYGVKPVIIAIIVQAIWRLGRAAVKTRTLAVVGLLACVASLVGLNELVVLFAGGALGAVLRLGWGRLRRAPRCSVLPIGLVATPVVAPAASAAMAAPFSLGAMALFFLKVGSVLFGSGYVLLAFLRADLVERWHWLTEGQLLDAIAVGQITPGPLFTTATFIGYVLAGPLGATVATAGIFLPAFFFVAVSGPLVPRLRRSASASAFLDGLNVSALALMLIVTVQIGEAALVDWLTCGLALAASILLLRWNTNSSWLVLGGAAIGLLGSVKF